MLHRLFFVLFLCSLIACSSTKDEGLPDDLSGEISELENEIFETEQDVAELSDEEGDGESLDVSSDDQEFEDPDLSIAADEGVSESELDFEDELDLDEEGTDVATDESTSDEDFDFDSFDEEDSDSNEGQNEEEQFADLDEGELDDDNLDFESLDGEDFGEVGESESPIISDEEEFSVTLEDDDLSDGSASDDDFAFESTEDSVDNVTIDDEDLIIDEDLGANTQTANNDLPLPSRNKVKSIDYDASAGGVFVITTEDPAEYSTEYIPETNQYVVEIKNTRIDQTLQRPFLTKDFQQNFGALNSYQDSDGDAKLVLQLKNDMTPYVTVDNNKFSISAGKELQALNAQNQQAVINQKNSSGGGASALSATTLEDYLLENTNYYGKPISIQVKDADIVDVIHLISEEVGANLVVSEGVTGKVSIKLKQVPWDQALITIMKTRGLGYVRAGSVLRIAPLAELQAESQAASAVQNARKSLAPFHVKVFPLSYASPETLEEKLTPFLTQPAEGSTRAGRLISENRSASIIVNDTKEVINNMEKLIKELDKPPLQVMIEAKVVEASKEFQKTIGSSFLNSASSNGANNNVNANNNFGWNPDGVSNFLQNTLQVTGLNFLGSLTHILRLSEIERKIKVLSAPKVLAINNEQATIVQISQVLNRTTTVEEGQPIITAEAIDVELRLEVTPQITSDSNVIMNLLIRRQFPGTVNADAGATPINTREAQTRVIVGNNKTAVIGGIYQVDTNKGEQGIPVLRKIPLLKWMFGNKEYRKTDSELMVFVTPRILNREGSLVPVGKTPKVATTKNETETL